MLRLLIKKAVMPGTATGVRVRNVETGCVELYIFIRAVYISEILFLLDFGKVRAYLACKFIFNFPGWETILLCEVIFERLVKFNNL